MNDAPILKPPRKMVQTTIRLPKDLLDELRAKGRSKGYSMALLCTQLLDWSVQMVKQREGK